MSEKTVYVCDGCKEEIKLSEIKAASKDGSLMAIKATIPFTVNDVHICNGCLHILYNLKQVGLEINFLD